CGRIPSSSLCITTFNLGFGPLVRALRLIGPAEMSGLFLPPIVALVATTSFAPRPENYAYLACYPEKQGRAPCRRWDLLRNRKSRRTPPSRLPLRSTSDSAILTARRKIWRA